MMPGKSTPSAPHRIPFWVVSTVIVTVLALLLTAYYLLKPLDGPVPAEAGAAYESLEQGWTADGFPRLGSTSAPILIEEFASYPCVHCREFHEDRFPALFERIAAGELQYVLIPVPHIGSGADDAVRAALCAGEQDQFWTMHDVLFHWQNKFITRTFDTKRLKKGAENLGLDLPAFESCLDTDRISAQLEAAERTFRQRGLQGTPSFFINGQKMRDYREFDRLDDLIEQIQSQGDS